MRLVHQLGRWTLFPACLALVQVSGAAGQDPAFLQSPNGWELNRMHDEALAPTYLTYLTTDAGVLEKAAWLHGRVADLRQEYDARRFHCLETQAHLLHAIGHLEGSQGYMVEAGEQAQATGDMFSAAMTYLDAALVAQEAERGFDARDLAYRAWTLSSSPGLERKERKQILTRIAGW